LGEEFEQADRDRIVELARQVVATSGFEPGFDVEPGRLAVLEEALEVVRSDMRAIDVEVTVVLPGSVRPEARASVRIFAQSLM
jgi:hypothetical protein